MNFDDILRNFDAQTRKPSDIEAESKVHDLQLLSTAWIQERMSPEILDYEGDLIDRILERLRKQVELIELNSIELQQQKKEIKLILVIVESELDRVSFLIRGYTRARLAKIDKYSLYIRNSDDEIKKLSNSELTYMGRHLELLEELFQNQFLNRLPESLQALDDTGGGISMIEEPDLDRAVFIKVINPSVIELDNEEIELTKGSVFVMRYRAIRHMVSTGDVVLI